MKTKLFIVLLIALAINGPFAVSAFDRKPLSGNVSVPAKTENKLTEEEAARLTKRVEEIRNMDKSNLSASEKRELRKELKNIKEKARRDGVIYIGAGTLLVIILILLLI